MAGGSGNGGMFSDPMTLALIAGTAIAAPYAAPLLFEGGMLAGSTMLGAGVTGMGIGALGGAVAGRDPMQMGLMGGLGGAAAAGMGVGAGSGGPQLVDAVSGPISGVGASAGAGASLIPGISNTALGVGAGGLGLMALMNKDRKQYGVPTNAQANWNGGSLQDFHYDRRNYDPLVPTPPNPPYQAQYQDRRNPRDTTSPMTPYQPVMAAGGGLMQDRTQFAAGGMYPGSQIDKTQYASSPQTPISMQSTMAGYDPMTNPITGEPTTHMAAGGSTSDTANNQVYQPQYARFSSPTDRAAVVDSYLTANDLNSLGNMYGVPSAASNSYAPMAQTMRQGLGAIPTPTQQAMPNASSFNPMLVPHNPMWQAEQNRIAAEAAAAEQARQEAEQAAQSVNVFGQPAYDNTGGGKAGGLMPRDLHYAAGGLANLGSYSDGGQLLKGPGDGMSDSIPASIGRKQPARLADNEFVVPADVVSHLGNGSSDAGAKKLYAMMNNVRKARTGKKKQAPQINASKYMPA